MEENRNILADMLDAIGVEVQTAESGSQALAQMHQELPDIVFMDIWMPGMDDIRVRTRAPALPGGAGAAGARSLGRRKTTPASLRRLGANKHIYYTAIESR